jgi:hypothetical protein
MEVSPDDSWKLGEEHGNVAGRKCHPKLRTEATSRTAHCGPRWGPCVSGTVLTSYARHPTSTGSRKCSPRCASHCQPTAPRAAAPHVASRTLHTCTRVCEPRPPGWACLPARACNAAEPVSHCARTAVAPVTAAASSHDALTACICAGDTWPYVSGHSRGGVGFTT